MAKRKAASVYEVPTQSPVIAEFQKLLKAQDGGFPWSKMLDQKEVRFVYDMTAWAAAKKDFLMTPPQAQWGIAILKKLDLSRQEWESTQSGQKRAARKGDKPKAKSTRKDLVARRLAKEHLKKAGLIVGRNTPADVELVRMLNGTGAIATPPTKATALTLLMAWAEEHQKGRG